MKPSFKIHLSNGSNNVETCVDQRRERDIILDIGGERFLSNRDVIQTFPATRSESEQSGFIEIFLGWED